MNSKELTQQQLEGMVRNLEDLEKLIELWQEFGQDFTDVDLDTDVTLSQRDLVREFIEECPDNLDTNPADVWLSDCLEIRELGHRSIGGEWESDGVKLLLTFGGPNIWLTIEHGNEWAQLEVFWGDSARQEVHVPNLAQFVTDLVESF